MQSWPPAHLHFAAMRPVVLLPSLQTGGAERVTLDFLVRLKGRGIDVPCCTVSSRRDGLLARELEEAGIERHDLDGGHLVDPLATWRFARLAKREKWDLVHAHG